MSEAPAQSLERRVTELLARGGRLASRWPSYEERPGQLALAVDVARAFERGEVLLAEAPTGLGKSLAYLLPAVLMAVERGQRVVVATCTRSLQDQLVERDLPALLQALEQSLPFARLKGKQNYVCTRVLESVEPRGAEEADELDRLRRWADHDAEGDLDRFPAADAESFRRLRGRIGADPEACTLATCRRGRECFWVRARRAAAERSLVVVNHALLALAGEVEGLLPDFDLLIVDEAHRLEGVLLAQLERRVSRHRFEEALRRIGAGRTGAGLAARVRSYALPLFRGDEGASDELDRLVARVAECREDAERFFGSVEPQGPRHELYGARARYRGTSELLGPDLAPLETLLRHCGQFARTLQRFSERIAESSTSSAAGELAAELEQAGGQWGALGIDLDRLGDAADPGWVYWRTAGGRGVELHGAPVTIGEHARRLVLARARAAVLTSATLTSGGDFSFLIERLGLGDEWGVPVVATRYPTPFDLERQMRTYVFDVAGDETRIADLVLALAAVTDRNQLVLFTAHERLRRARERLLGALPAERLLLAQDWDGAAGALAERFRRARGAVLLGVQSLWEGVDFPGEALEVLVVAKLPFTVPDDPLVEARGERLRERGLDPFRFDAVPEAVLRFRQGVGRLIRRADDRGVLIVCDPRLVHASYRKPFLEALPGAPVRMSDAQALAQDAARFLSETVTVEDDA